jgi:hypothetical protein
MIGGTIYLDLAAFKSLMCGKLPETRACILKELRILSSSIYGSEIFALLSFSPYKLRRRVNLKAIGYPKGIGRIQRTNNLSWNLSPLN